MTDDQNFETPQVEEEASPLNACGRFMRYIRGSVLTGIIVTAPLVITIWLLRIVIITLDEFMLNFIPPRFHMDNVLENRFGVYLPFEIHGLGLLAGFVFVLLVGILTRNFFGRKLVSLGEYVLNQIPGVRSVYVSIKQVIETIASTNSKSFRQVVMVEYPRKGIWAIAFVTGKTKGEVQQLTDDEVLNVFLPTTPNPTSGFLLFVSKKDLIPLHMTIEQGLKMVISAGIVTPTLSEGKQALKQKPE